MFARTSLRCFKSLARSQLNRRIVALAVLQPIGPTTGVQDRSFSTSCRLSRDDVEPGEESNAFRVPIQSTQAKLNEIESTSTPPITLTEFETLAKHDAATIDHARRCLEHLKAQLMPLPLEERRGAAAKTDAGRKILLWLWTEHGTDPAAFLHTGKAKIDPDLCWFLLAQGLEEYIWKWIESEVPSAADLARLSDFESEKQRLTWVGPLLAGLTRAHYDWSEDGTYDSALRAFSRSRSIFQAYGSTGDKLLELPFWTLASLVSRQNRREPNADLYNILMGYHEAQYPSHDERKKRWWYYTKAVFMLRHPQHPDPQALLQFFRYNMSVVGMGKADAKTRYGFGARMLEAAYILHHRLRADDAADLEGFVQRECRKAWDRRSVILKYLECQERLANIRREGVVISWGSQEHA